MKYIFNIVISLVVFYSSGQNLDQKRIAEKKQTIKNFIYSKQKVDAKNSFVNYIHFDKKEYKRLLKIHGNTIYQEYMIDMVEKDYLVSVKEKIENKNYSIIHESELGSSESYKLILPKEKSSYDIYYLVDKYKRVELSFIFEKDENKIKYFLNDPFPPVFGQKVPVTYLEYFKILTPEDD